MLKALINKPQFEYDIHSLIKAFYPGEDVKVWCEETAAPKKEEDGENGGCLEKEEGITVIFIDFEEDGIRMWLGEKKEEVGEWIAHDAKADRAEVKNVLKQLIYKVLSKHLDKELPWGTLTGIRPTKIPMGRLEDGWPEGDILDEMRRTYYISKEKGNLSIDIAKREKDILSSLHYKDGYSLYIGIPFCPTTCLYCSFTSYPIGLWKKRVGAYLDALEKEMAYVGEIYKDKILDTVYIGGGTPTTLEHDELDRLLSMIGKYFNLSHVQELTVEAGRADSITREKLKTLKKYPVTRISVNPQTMKEETLKIIGRQHSVEQVKEAFAMAREEGFANINMDIILGLPGEGEEDVAYTMDEIQKLHPDSLTVHSLAIKRASGLNRWIEENGISTLNNTDTTMEIAAKAAKDMGMQPYYLYRQKNMSGNFENVGYARPGKYGIYNILIMEEKQTIVACGAGSISKRVYPDGRIERCENVKDVASFIERIDEMIERKRKLLED
ncbi:MAG: coproporphyrinogen dehydrogenase HemZ [Lachnospiraceae bacterium]|jgi:oxygen-independent coproporphyrinogen-3 oxidase|nr:coproporphyrinogen dehydrogenase HemZ [Lachnospiraceae bacterium]